MSGKLRSGDLYEQFLEFTDITAVFQILTRSEYLVYGKMMEIRDKGSNDNKIYLEDIKSALNIPMQKVSGIVRNMSDEGLVVWKLDEETKKTYIELTANGIQKYNLQKSGMSKMSNRIDNEMDDDEKEILSNVLEKISSILKEECDQARAYVELISGDFGGEMNVIGLLKPKSTVTYIKKEDALDVAITILHDSGYSTVPVVDKKGKYVGTISEGDLLWFINENGMEALKSSSAGDLANKKRNPAVRDMVDSRTIVHDIMSQNFLSMVDDRNCFIGIITRKDIIKFLRQKAEKKI